MTIENAPGGGLAEQFEVKAVEDEKLEKWITIACNETRSADGGGEPPFSVWQVCQIARRLIRDAERMRGEKDVLNARLAEALANRKRPWLAYEQLKERLVAAEAQVAGLREALEKIKVHPNVGETAKLIANAALQQEGVGKP